MPIQPGTVYLVGAGPGDPGLLTVRARELLDECDDIVHDALANPALLRRQGSGDEPDARGEAAPKPRLHFVGKRGGDASSASQDEISALLISLAREGRRVVRLKGGDPLVFGRGGEEAQALAAAGITFEIVPGVTAGVAAPAYAGIPVTHRRMAAAVTFVTGHEDPSKPESQTDWSALARAGGTIVLYMGVGALPRICGALVSGGLDPATPAASIEWGTWPRQRTILATVETLAARTAEAGLAAPVITVIGAVAQLRAQIAWFDRRPLFGTRVVVTRASAQVSELARRMRDLGADVLEMPATRIERLDPAPLHAAHARLAEYQWAIFTSGNAVRIFWQELRAMERDARALAGVKVAAVGPATADALLAHGLAVDLVPERYVAEGVLEAFRERLDLAGARVLYASAEGARDVLPRGLRELGAEVDVIALYRSVSDGAGAADLHAALESGSVTLVTLASASAARAYVELLGEAARRAPVVSIGPITTEAAHAAGLEVIAEARDSTIAGLVQAVLDAVAARGGIRLAP